MNLFGGIYRGRRVLITGHTGFKGSWLSLWLSSLGAEVTGIALPPETSPNHWDLLSLKINDHRIDVRDFDAINSILRNEQPEIVFHLAAQPLVRRSYAAPLETWSSNVMGTANVLEACRLSSSVKAVVVITTDKCYENKEWPWGYRENDRLGGHDPYSASKSAAEFVSASYRHSFFDGRSAVKLATARAGNVIGGGDWSVDRLLPDVVRAMADGKMLEVRAPNATRPWQHVLECLSGYLLLGRQLLLGDECASTAWNFGPGPDGNRSVADVLNTLGQCWPGLSWKVNQSQQPHEATLLYLDSAKARVQLGWSPIWNLDTAIRMTATWYRVWIDQREIETRHQLDEYVFAARAAGVGWALP
jgi:CDP-glucose 4,6-dehydratase